MPPFLGYPLDTNRTNATPQTNRHPADHNEERAALNDLQGQVTAVDAAVTPLNAMISGGETGPDSAGPTSGATPLTFNTFTLVAPGVPGRLHVWLSAIYTKTVGTDRFTVLLQANSTTFATAAEESPAERTTYPFDVSGSVAIGGGAGVVVDCIISRTSGTGTATLGAGTGVSLHHIFIPT